MLITSSSSQSQRKSADYSVNWKDNSPLPNEAPAAAFTLAARLLFRFAEKGMKSPAANPMQRTGW